MREEKGPGSPAGWGLKALVNSSHPRRGASEDPPTCPSYKKSVSKHQQRKAIPCHLQIFSLRIHDVIILLPPSAPLGLSLRLAGQCSKGKRRKEHTGFYTQFSPVSWPGSLCPPQPPSRKEHRCTGCFFPHPLVPCVSQLHAWPQKSGRWGSLPCRAQHSWAA